MTSQEAGLNLSWAKGYRDSEPVPTTEKGTGLRTLMNHASSTWALDDRYARTPFFPKNPPKAALGLHKLALRTSQGCWLMRCLATPGGFQRQDVMGDVGGLLF